MSKILILDLNFEKESLFFDEFVKPVEDIVKEETLNYEIKHYKDLNDQETNNYNKIILCGVSLKDNDYLNYLKKFEWLKNYNGKVFGICGGAQIIVKLFSGNLIENIEIGIKEFKILKQNKLFKNIDLNKGYCLHNTSIITNENFDKLIESKNTLELVKLKNKDFYACLFHPEVRNKDLISNFIKL